MSAPVLHQISVPMLTHGVNRDRKVKTYEDVPTFIRLSNSYKICALISLAWDYIDTVLDSATRQRISALKSSTRKIREHLADYTHHLKQFLNSVALRKEFHRGLMVECMVKDSLKTFRASIADHIASHDLTEDHQELLEAVYDAEVVVRAVFRLWDCMSDQATNEFRAYISEGSSIINVSFVKASKLLPDFGGDCFDKNLDCINEAARSIARVVFDFDMLNYVYKTEAAWLFGEYQKRKEDICETECLDRLKKRFIRACAYKPEMIAHYNGNEVKIARVQIGKDGYEIYVYPKRKADGEWSKRPLKAVGGCESIDVIFNNELWN